MKIAFISDTHTQHERLSLPAADMIIHGGDFSHNEIQAFQFLEWYGSLPYKYKILIAGNHDFLAYNEGIEGFKSLCKEVGVIYLQDEELVIDGIKFYGAPWSPIFGNWAFMEDDMELYDRWLEIPNDVDVLITHGPQYLVGDMVQQDIINPHVGSKTLSIKMKELINLKYHLVGHIHEAYGIYPSDTYTTINGSVYNYWNGEVREVPVFDI